MVEKWAVPQKLNMRVYIPKRNESICPRKNICAQWPNCGNILKVYQLVTGLKKKKVIQWYTNNMKYYPAIKKTKVLIHDPTWMNPDK